jgi:hypothetical protein
VYDQPPLPPEHPADAVRADLREMTGPGLHERRDTWQIVIIHIEGRWQPALLTQWVRLPDGWVAHVRWRDDPRRPAEGWGWFRHEERTIQPLSADGLYAAGLVDDEPRT